MQNNYQQVVEPYSGLSEAQFSFIRKFIRQKAGIVLSDSKQYLVESRLKHVAKIFGLSDVGLLCDRLQRTPDIQLETMVIDALTTNETLWFRDKKPFDALLEMYLPWLEKQTDSRSLRIWCAGCSSGQEPYSLILMFTEENIFKTWDVRVIATDISQGILERAKKGIYSQLEVNRGLPAKMLVKYFKQLETGEWQLSSQIRSKVVFRKHNLLTDAPPDSRLNLIFCRNVLIYFDIQKKREILERFHKRLAPLGLLVLGASETTLGITDIFQPVKLGQATFFCKPEEKAALKALAESAASLR